MLKWSKTVENVIRIIKKILIDDNTVILFVNHN